MKVKPNLCLCLYCRLLLQKERQQREDAERQQRELEERLRRYETDYEEAREGVYLGFGKISYSLAPKINDASNTIITG